MRPTTWLYPCGTPHGAGPPVRNVDPGLYASDTVPQDGLVAEYLLTQDIAPDNAGHHDGAINGGVWTPQ
jgi:hypothetical protein